MCDAILRVWQEAELRAKAESREMARNAVGVMGAGGDPRHKQRQYAEELEEQLRMKKVTGFGNPDRYLTPRVTCRYVSTLAACMVCRRRS